MKIVVLEKIEMTESQRIRLEKLGDVEWYEGLSEQENKEKNKDADIVVVDWVDPSPFVLSMKKPSLLALMSTGYAWVNHRDEARKKGVLVSNVPGYATEAVAEHLVGLMLSAARSTAAGDRRIRADAKEKACARGFELKGRKLGIVGLGRIGTRAAEIAKVFGMDIMTANRHKKNAAGIADVSLEELLRQSDIVCVSCPLNDESRNMLDRNKLSLMKKGAIIVTATWGVVVLSDLAAVLNNGHLHGAGIDVEVEVEKIKLPQDVLDCENLILTPHVGFNTFEAKTRQVDICLSNIEAFINGDPQNVVN